MVFKAGRACWRQHISPWSHLTYPGSIFVHEGRMQVDVAMLIC